MVPVAAFFGWRAFVHLGPVAGALVAAGLLGFVIPIMRSCLIADDDGLADRRAIRTVRVPWRLVAEFRVERPGGIWGGFCVVAARRDGTQVDLLSTRPTRGLLPRVTSTNCSGCAGPWRNAWPRAARTCRQIRS
jgi:hypothetical protein